MALMEWIGLCHPHTTSQCRRGAIIIRTINAARASIPLSAAVTAIKLRGPKVVLVGDCWLRHPP